MFDHYFLELYIFGFLFFWIMLYFTRFREAEVSFGQLMLMLLYSVCPLVNLVIGSVLFFTFTIDYMGGFRGFYWNATERKFKLTEKDRN